MSILTENLVGLGASAASKEDAIRQAGQLLVDGGCVSANYVAGMLAREATMSTFLGNGVAIPHGMHENRADIQKTGISVLQLPAGVVWDDDDPDEKVHLVIGIAAASDEHMDILMNLAEVVEDPDDVAVLANTNDVALLVERLSQAPEPI
jgi:phosphocarrier protein FPr